MINECVKFVLNEMPYTSNYDKGFYDLEAELFQKDYVGFCKKVKDILDGKLHTDKYGGTIKLKKKDATMWAREIMEEPDVMNMVTKKFKKTWDEFWDDVGFTF